MTIDLNGLTSQQKREALIRELKARAALADRKAPMSYGQKSLWFLYMNDATSISYNTAFTARIGNGVDVAALKHAFTALLARHESLRTTYTFENGAPCQVISAHGGLDFAEIQAEDWAEETLRQRIQMDFERPFNLETGPVCRVSLYRRGPEDHILLWAIHHIAYDGWSLWCMLEELGQLYRSKCQGWAAKLPPVTATYERFAREQSAWLASPAGEAAWAYWKSALSGELPVLELPTDRPRPPRQTSNGASLTFRFDPGRTEALRRLAKQEGATLYAVLLAAWQALLGKYCGQEQVLVGSPAMVREQADFAGTVGYFVNPIVLRGDLTGDPAFAGLVARTRRQVLDGLAHQAYPFPLLVERLNVNRDPSRAPLFQTLFVLQKPNRASQVAGLLGMGEAGTEVDLGGLALTPYEIDQQEGQFDLSLDMIEGNRSLFGVIKYNTDLFDRCTIQRLEDHFQNLVKQVAADPNLRLSEIEISGREELATLETWGRGPVSPRPSTDLYARLAEAAAAHADAIAVNGMGANLTFGVLFVRAETLSQQLMAEGVGPEVPVAVAMEPGTEMVVALLAIMHAGGVYVPLDPGQPKPRLLTILEDLDQPLLLVDGPPAEWESLYPGRVFAMDRARCQPVGRAVPRPGACPDQAMYIIYTSGSTGKPKGVTVQHRSVVNYLDWVNGLLGEVVLPFTSSFTFDASLKQIFGMLLKGQPVRILPPGTILDGAALEQVLRRVPNAGLNCVPSVWQHLLEGGTLPQPAMLLLGGEVLGPRLVTGTKRWLPNVPVINLYGPTEATANAAYDTVAEEAAPSIGRPLTNTRLNIAGPTLRRQPLGAPGELLIGGLGLARGYAGQPALTAAKFVPDPFAEVPGERLYRTGDRVRYLNDGRIQFLGRIDRQIKLRGFRLELGDIETTLREHPRVENAVVLLHGVDTGQPQLVAFVQSNLDESSLRVWLRERLPDYMVPAILLPLETLPKNPSGKPDRSALLTMVPQARAGGRQPARNPFEAMMLEIWQEVLGASHLGIHDRFFESGGHSLLAVKLMSRVRAVFSVALPVSSLFTSPTPAGLCLEVEKFRGNKGPDPVRKRKPDQDVPLSFAQEQLWTLDRMGAGAAYNMAAGFEIRGALDTAALKVAFTAIVERHEVLRTRISGEDPPFQSIDKAGAVTCPLIDLSRMTAEAQAAHLDRILKNEGERRFDLEKEHPFRAGLIRLQAHQHVLFITMHHICADGWSVDLLFKELASRYHSFADGKPASLPPLKLQYADYAVWQRDPLRADAFASQLDYWRNQLAGCAFQRLIKPDFSGQTPHRQRGACLRFEVYAACCRRLKNMPATLFTVLHAAFAYLLSHHAGKEEILVGTPVANRGQEGLAPLIGNFVNTVVLVTRVENATTFGDLLAQVHETALNAFSNQELPFESLVRDLRQDRGRDGGSLFQVLFVHNNISPAAPQLDGLEVDLLARTGIVPKFDLTLRTREHGDRLFGEFEYDADLFDAETIRRLMAHFLQLLEDVEPARPLAGLLQPAGEALQRLLAAGQGPRVASGGGRTLNTLFAERAAMHPDRVALTWDHGQLTYAALKARLEPLAAYLQQVGAGPGRLVGVCLPRSPEQMVALWAILLAGGAYVPLDPAYPDKRLRWMVADAGIELLITTQDLAGRFAGCQLKLVDLDRVPNTDHHLIDRVGPENLAYVIYTSGSTGQPKGVMVKHGGVVNLFDALNREVYGRHASAPMRVAVNGSLSFDTSVKQIIQLLGGHSLEVVPEDVRLDGRAMAAFLNRRALQAFDVTPEQLETLLDSGLMTVRTLSDVLVGGDAVSQRVWRKLRASQEIRFFNVYGPTECTVDATIARIGEKRGIPVIGRPIANTDLVLMDAQLKPVPKGMVGEITIAGSGLARGYHHRPALTAAAFVPNPFGNGTRVYKTGDRARFNASGELAFLGRIDHQLKVRGHRLEAGEIERILETLPAIERAVVMLVSDRLVAFVKGACAEAELKAFLSGALPDYMRPSLFVTIDAFPQTPNGKLDRRALAGRAGEGRRLADDDGRPRNDFETLLAEQWARVLEYPAGSTPGIHANFFELGGHSLLATRLVARLREVFRIELPVKTLFEAPTIAGLATRMADLQKGEHTLAPVMVPRPADSVCLPLSFAQERLWFLDRLEGGAIYNMAAAMRLEGHLDVNALHGAFLEMMRRHESLRTIFPERDGRPIQQVLPDIAMPLSRVDLGGLGESERTNTLRELMTRELHFRFDLARGPLMRLTLVHLGTGQWALLVTLHHIVSDGWSTGIILRELKAIYSSRVFAKPTTPGPLALQYPDFALWQRQWLAGAVLDRKIAWWKRHLEDAPVLLNLPADRQRPARQTHRGGRVDFHANQDLSDALEVLAKEVGVTRFMLLLASFGALLARFSGDLDMVIGCPSANRTHAETEDLIGFFINTLPLRLNFEGDPALSEMLPRVRRTVLDAFLHQDAPLENIVEAVQPERHMGHSPLFQVTLVLQNASQEKTLSLPGLTVSHLPQSDVVAKYDLTLLAEETAQGLSFGLVFNADLFDEATMRRFASWYLNLLACFANAPHLRLSECDLLTAEARQVMVVDWNRKRLHAFEDACLHHLFEAAARKYPSNPAIRGEGGAVTYAELNGRANRLAHKLRDIGIGPEKLVGLYLDRSASAIVAILGVLKAGGAYLPLDPANPLARTQQILREAAPGILLHQGGLPDALAWPGPSLDVVGFESEPAAQSFLDLEGNGCPQHPAYVIFTSGSTGKPKGVVIPHAGVAHLIRGKIADFDVTTDSRILNFASLSFDISVWEWGLALCSGASLCIPQGEARLPGEALVRFLKDQAITHVALTPSTLAVLPSDALPAARVIFAGGETCPPGLIEPWLRHRRVVHGYGPTEASICAAWQECGETADGLPIGFPVSGTQIHLLDPMFHLSLPGSPGELCIGGRGLARGYDRQPGLTAARFVPNPYGEAGSRLYRSGDLARYLANGAIAFLGRLDHQIKIRGFRVELDEIEKVLTQCPAVKDAVVIGIERGGAVTSLAAFATLHRIGGHPDLRTFLASRLPDYMVPGTVMVVEAFPQTPGDKIDRKALVRMAAPGSDRQMVRPVGPLQEMVASIWEDQLGVATVSMTDHFFELGGHSLVATRVITRVRDVFQCDLPLASLFESPTLEDFCQKVEDRIAGGTETASLPPVKRQDASQNHPLSFAQERMWFMETLSEQGASGYAMPFALRLRGALDMPVLEASIGRLAARHEMLRTTFPRTDEGPYQQVHDAAGFSLERLRAEGDWQQAMAAQARQPFDLERGPLFRAVLLEIGVDDHLLFVSMHHIISDGWSMSIFFRELDECYRSGLDGEAPALPELSLRYGDYCRWQRSWPQAYLAGRLEDWAHRLADAPELLELPLDRPRPPVQTTAGAVTPFVLDRSTRLGLQKLARSQNATLFMVLQSAFSVFLGRFAGVEDVVMGTPVANRAHAEAEPLLGLFVNTLVLRTKLSGDPSFLSLLKQVRGDVLAAFSYQDVPFEKLVERLAPERHLSYAPIFQVMFVMQKLTADFSLGDLAVEPVSAATTTALFDLTLTVIEAGETLRCGFTYNTDLFDEETVARFSQAFQMLVASILGAPNLPVSQLAILSQNQRHRLLGEWRGRSVAYPADQMLHQLFEAQVAKTPTAPAIRDAARGETLTYEALNRRANALAHALLDEGVGPDRLVAICMDREPWAVAAMLAVLKAGGAYVPIDPTYPKARRDYILQDAGAALLITHAEESERGRIPCLSLETLAGRLKSYPQRNPENRVHPLNLAYMIYTSGSTGKPKAVMITHASIVNRMHFGKATYPLDGRDRMLSVTSLGFDISVWEIFTPLLSGATLVLARDSGDPVGLCGIMGQERITVVGVVPSLLRALLEVPEFAACTSLRHVFCGAEVLAPELVARFYGQSEAALYNLYGPTEAAIDATFHTCDRLAQPGRIPIGKPIANATTVVLGPGLGLMPAGAKGQLFVGGAGLARGYHRRPALTAARFIPDPFSDQPGQRLYQTGDMARFLADGCVDFFGRGDHQVKIRGFRIELGEVEAALTRVEGVRSAAAIARADRMGQQQLLAFVTLSESLSGAALRDALSETMPSYMVPSRVVTLAAMPLNASGKIDRRALQQMPLDQPQKDSNGHQGHHETMLRAIWCRILDLEDVAREANFFELGGHSLLAASVVAKVRSVFGIDVAVKDLFERPTLSAFANRVRSLADRRSGIPALRPMDQDGPVPLSFAQHRLWFLDQLGGSSYVVPAVLDLKGTLRIPILEAVFDHLLERHASLRTVFITQDGEPVQRIQGHRRFQLPVIDGGPWAGEPPQEWRFLIDPLLTEPFDLAQGPLFRAFLLRLGAQRHVLAIAMHHIVTDGWSIGILIREFTQLYRAFANDLPSPLEPPVLQYADYAVWQRGWLGGEVVAKQLDYWITKLSGAPPLLSLQGQKPRPRERGLRAGSWRFQVGKDLTQSLENLTRETNGTLFMTLLSAFLVLLRKYAKRDGMVVGTDVANRNHAGLEDMVGFFVNQLVLREEVRSEISFRDLLIQVRENTLEAFTHQDVPFDKVVQALQPQRNPEYAPLFQIKFVYQNTPASHLDLGDLQVEPLEVTLEAARELDLTLMLEKRNGLLHGLVSFDRDVFEPAFVRQMFSQFQTLLASVVARPDAAIGALFIQKKSRKRQHVMTPRKTTRSSFGDFSKVKPKAINLEEARVVSMAPLLPDRTLPLVIEPLAGDLSFPSWARANREELAGLLVRHGGLLFRGFALKSIEDFEEMAAALCSGLFNQNGEHPRESLSGNVATPVFYPPEKKLLWHNENSFNHEWPMKILFGCLKPAERGGETPLADSREVFRRIDPAIRRRFEAHGLIYMRNYTRGIGRSWQEVFCTKSRAEVEAFCRQNYLDYEWKTGDRLCTRALRPATMRHPVTGDMSWFNQAQHWHISCLDDETRAAILDICAEEDVPRNCFYGNGKPIDSSVMQEILAVYDACGVAFPWQKGDLVLLDNLLCAHARNPFEGVRRLLVAMGEMSRYPDPTLRKEAAHAKPQ